jgi:DNA-binding transcriptional regulator YhcF (GntR family)
MATEQKKHAYMLPERYRQALEDIEAAGGTVSDFMLDLVEKAEKQGISDKEIIETLKDHYQADES